jgi:hypothetical protein
LEGRRGEILESIRGLKVTNEDWVWVPFSLFLSHQTHHIALQRKISTPEYKNVDEEHRVAMIKHETTQMAVRDLEKYHSALDKVRLCVPLW